MVYVFTPNKNGKIEFTREQLEQLLREVWNEGYYYNNTPTPHSPWFVPYYNTDNITVSTTDPITVSNTEPVITFVTNATNYHED